MKTTLETSGEDVKTTLETSGEDVKTTLETSGEDVKTTLETSGEDVPIETRQGLGDGSRCGQGQKVLCPLPRRIFPTRFECSFHDPLLHVLSKFTE